jgi:hypothetical protein
MAAEQGGRGTGPAAAAWLAWSVLGSTMLLLLAGVGIVLGVEPGAPYDSWLILLVNAPVFATIGAVLAARRPDHPIGWLFCGIGLANAAQLVTGSYAAAALSRALPGGAVAAWVTEELRLLAFGAIVLSLLLFPTGRLPSWRWRWVVGLGAVGLASLMAREGLTPGPSQELLGHRNPFGLTGVPGLLDGLGLLEELFYMAELAAVLSLVLRLRRARGVERQQLKWFVYAAVLARRRVQQAVDRRFDRRRYDAARTVEGFSARLRDELDLDTLSSELLAVVDRTVQPAGVSLWLRRGSGRP